MRTYARTRIVFYFLLYYCICMCRKDAVFDVKVSYFWVESTLFSPQKEATYYINVM